MCFGADFILRPCCHTKRKDSIWGLESPNSNSLISCTNRKNRNLCPIQTKKKKSKLLWFSPSLSSSNVPLHPHSHLPTLPSLWSVLGSAMMAWTATMASLILVWSSLSSSICSRRRIWAASFRVASEKKFILVSHWWFCFIGYMCPHCSTLQSVTIKKVGNHWLTPPQFALPVLLA